jgi:hypothetical protein
LRHGATGERPHFLHDGGAASVMRALERKSSIRTGNLRVDQCGFRLAIAGLIAPGKFNLGRQAMTGRRYQPESESLRGFGLLGFGRVVDFNVGRFYRNFGQTDDDEVRELLAASRDTRNFA